MWCEKCEEACCSTNVSSQKVSYAIIKKKLNYKNEQKCGQITLFPIALQKNAANEWLHAMPVKWNIECLTQFKNINQSNNQTIYGNSKNVPLVF